MIEVKKFYADWCGPCKMLTPVIEGVKNKFTDIKFENINVDENYEIAQKYFVRNVPTVIIEKDGEIIERFVGVQAEMTYTNAINELKSA